MKVLVTTSGLGTRLGNMTAHTNKSLVPVGGKPAISRIVDSYPPGTEFVVTLGHFGEQVRDFLTLAYPKEAFSFVWVDNFSGEGSSLAYSIYCARAELDGPFIFNAGDTITSSQEVDSIEVNWLAGFTAGDASLYASFETRGPRVSKILPKGAEQYDFLYIGQAGVHDYKSFWDQLEELLEGRTAPSEMNDLSVFEKMIEAGCQFEFKVADDWFDVGSISGLLEARSNFETDVPTLAKDTQAVFHVGGQILKFDADSRVSESKVSRAGLLSPVVPGIVGHRGNWFSYSYVDGMVASSAISPELVAGLLDWGNESLWGLKLEGFDDQDFKENCRIFYVEKSRKRIESFCRSSSIRDAKGEINGAATPSALEMVAEIETSGLWVGTPGRFHGDFVLDNIIVTDRGYVAIDWRESFGGSLSIGDIYYDIAKLNHSLVMDHRILNRGEFEVRHNAQGTWLDLLRRQQSVEAQSTVREFCLRQNLSWDRVRLLTALIWINMAPLHGPRLGEFLYYYGRLSLFRVMKSLDLQLTFQEGGVPN